MKHIFLSLTITLSIFCVNAQENCDFVETIFNSQNANEEWILSSSQINEGLEGCLDSNGLTYEVGAEMFINQCDYIVCEGNNEWTDIMTIENCNSIECIDGACTDVSELNQDGSYSSLEECQTECETNNELPYECIFDACVDVSILGQEGSYSNLEECQESCGEQLPYECLFGNCVDVSLFNQEGSYSRNTIIFRKACYSRL